MNNGGFSWKRLLGVTAFKQRISRKTGIPFTKAGRQRKAFRGGIAALLYTIFIDGWK